MRLTEREKSAILELAAGHFGEDCRVTLFGSRVDDAGRGGDIDLFVETSLDAQEAHDARVPFLVELKKRIGDRRIDLVVATPQSEEKPVHRVAREEGVLLT